MLRGLRLPPAGLTLFATALLLLPASCAPMDSPSGPSFTIAKWHNDHTAAISITNDDAPDRNDPVAAFVTSLGLVLDYEMPTQSMMNGWLPDWAERDLGALVAEGLPGRVFDQLPPARLDFLLNELIPQGFGYFGHGHWHVDHDWLDYEDALLSFRVNYEALQRLGLKPVAYGYPRNMGAEPETRRALAEAGFLAARGGAWESPYLVPDDATAPEDWFALTPLLMESLDFQDCDHCINDTAELIPVLDAALERRAWLIPMYHSVGNAAGYGFYDWQTFQADMRAIAARDFWVAPMNNVVLYLRERAAATIDMQVVAANGITERIELTLSDGLDNATFDQPLTLRFTPPPDWAGAPLQITQARRPPLWRYPARDGVLLSLPPNEQPWVITPWRPTTAR